MSEKSSWIFVTEWHTIHVHSKVSDKLTCRSLPSVPYTAPSTPWESRHTTQLSTVRCSGRLEKFSMQVLIPYTRIRARTSISICGQSQRNNLSVQISQKLYSNIFILTNGNTQLRVWLKCAGWHPLTSNGCAVNNQVQGRICASGLKLIKCEVWFFCDKPPTFLRHQWKWADQNKSYIKKTFLHHVPSLS